MEQSSLFGDGVDIDTETPASTDTAAPADTRAQAAARAAELRHELDYHAYRYYMLARSRTLPLTKCSLNCKKSRLPTPTW